MHGAALQFGSGGPVNLPGPPTPVKIPPSHFAPEVKVRIPVNVNGQVMWVPKPNYEKFKRTRETKRIEGLPAPPQKKVIRRKHIIKYKGKILNTFFMNVTVEKFSPQGYASKCRALKRAATCGGVPTKMTPMKRLKIDVAYLTRALEEERARRGKAEAALSKIYYNRRESAHFRAAASKRHLPC